MEYLEKAKYHIIQSGDYLHVVCAKCSEPCELDFLGRDPTMVLVEIKCETCGSSDSWKLYKAGEGFPDEAWKPKRKS